MLEQYPDILTIKDFCNILQISRKTAYRLLAEYPEIAYRKIGRSYRISKESLISFIRCSQLYGHACITDITTC